MKNSLSIIAALLCALSLAGCREKSVAPVQDALSAGALVIARQGVFASGGTVTEPVAGTYQPAQSWLDMTRAGNTAHVDHASTFYQIPATERGAPVVYLHGYGQSRTGWQTTPDGREGWSDIFLRKGHAAFLVDQPRRASAGSTARMASAGGIDAWGLDGKDYMPGDQAWYTHFRIGLVAPDRYEGSAFPAGSEAQNQFFRQMTPNTGDYDEALFGAVLSEVLSDVRKVTAPPAKPGAWKCEPLKADCYLSKSSCLSSSSWCRIYSRTASSSYPTVLT